MFAKLIISYYNSFDNRVKNNQTIQRQTWTLYNFRKLLKKCLVLPLKIMYSLLDILTEVFVSINLYIL